MKIGNRGPSVEQARPTPDSTFPMTRRGFVTGAATALLASAGASLSATSGPAGLESGYATARLKSLIADIISDFQGRSFDFQVVGPLARDARDLALALNVLGGATGDEAIAWNWRMPPPRQKRLRDFRIGYVIGQRSVRDAVDLPGAATLPRNEPVASDLIEVYENVLSALARAGARLEQGWPDGIDFRSQSETHTYLGLSRLNRSEEQLTQDRRRLQENPNNRTALAFAGPHSRWSLETERQLGFRATWQTYFRTHDVFLLPTAATAAFPHDHSEPSFERRIDTPDGKFTSDDFGYWSVFATVPGLPATVAPAGRTRSGLPAGIQIIAPMWEDGTSIEFAALLGDLIGGFIPPPGCGSS